MKYRMIKDAENGIIIDCCCVALVAIPIIIILVCLFME